MLRAQRKNLGTAGFWRYVSALLVAVSGCSDSGTETIQIAALRFVTQPANVGAGVPMTVTVELLSDDDTRVTSATDEVTLSASGGATLGGTTTVDAVGGLATFNNVTVSTVGQNFQLTASAGEINTTSSTFAVVPGPATVQQSTMTAPANVTANADATLTFRFRDALNNALGGAAVSVSTDLAGATFTPPGGTTEADGSFTTVFRAPTSGAASVTVNIAGTSITFPTVIDVAAGASALRFVTQPSNVNAGQAFPVSVEIIDNSGQRVVTATDQVTLAPSTGTLQGTATANAVAGVATFNALSINGAAAGVVITASSGSLSAQSDPFNISPGPPTLARSTAVFSPSLTTGAQSVGTFTFRDAFNNPIPDVAVALSSSMQGTTFAPGSGTTNASGVLTSTVTAGSGPGTIAATVGGVGLDFSVCLVNPMTVGTPTAATIAGGTGCSLNDHPAATFRLTIPGASAVAVTVGATSTGGLIPELAITSDPLSGGTIVFSPSAPGGTRDWLLAPGTYLLSVSSTTGATGSFTVNTTNAGAGAPGCVVRLLVPVNATYAGTLSAGPPPDCIDASGPYFEDALAIFDDRQCTISLTSTAFDTYLLIRDHMGQNILDENDDVSASTTNSGLTRQCRNGANPIIIAPSSFDANISGAYILTISFAGAGAGQQAEIITIPPASLRKLEGANARDVFRRARVKR
jgi:hypothetical protein